MENNTVYDEVFFHEEYSAEYNELRKKYRSRVQNAICGRAVDHNPVPNATTVVHLNKDEDGGVQIVTTGDFVDFFNKKYGNGDRVGEVRRSLEQARIRAARLKEKEEDEQARRAAMKQTAERGALPAVRTAKRHLIFTNAFFALLFMLSISLLVCSSLVLDRANTRVAALSAEVTMLRGNEPAEKEAPTSDRILDYYEAHEAQITLSEGNSVEFFESERQGIEMSALLNALLGGE